MSDVKPPAETDRPDPVKLRARIGGQVLRLLGGPAGRVAQVRPLWGNFYRVNVVVSPETVGDARIPNSYFLEADGDGNIVTSDPAIAGPG
jgi:hypothetical protein